MKRWLPVAALVAGGALTGCVSMSGLDASDKFSCKAPDGVACQSLSGVYSNSVQNNLPFQKQATAGGKAAVPAQESTPDARPATPLPAAGERTKISPKEMEAPSSGMPIRQPPLVLRIWMAPWQDEDEVLHDQSYIYTMVHSGKWLIEANRNAISNQYRPVFPLKRPGPEANHSDAQSGTEQRHDNAADRPPVIPGSPLQSR